MTFKHADLIRVPTQTMTCAGCHYNHDDGPSDCTCHSPRGADPHCISDDGAQQFIFVAPEEVEK